MSDKFHINPTSGVVSRCRAHGGNCPFGSADEHYDNMEQARAGYENMMASATTPPATSKSGMRELNAQVKTTADLAVMQDALERGSALTHTNLAKNPNAPTEVLEQLYAKEDPRLDKNIRNHPNMPVDKLRGEDMAAIVREEPWGNRAQAVARSNAIGDHNIDALTDAASSFALLDVLKNPDNQLSQEKFIALSERSINTMGAGLASGRYPMERLAAATPESGLVYWGNVSRETKPEVLETYAAWAVKHQDAGIAREVFRNKDTSAETREKLFNEMPGDDLAMAALKDESGRTSPAMRVAASGKSDTTRSLYKVQELEKMVGGDLRSQIVKASNGIPSQGQRRSIQFDPEKVQELGMTKLDVDTFVRYHGPGNYLFGATYNEQTGNYNGYID